jgi:pyrimidine-nucleoside phosphorylase
MQFNPVEIILKKRNGEKLSKAELTYFIRSYLTEEIPEYQMSALLMAIFFKDMQPEEVYTLTNIYIESGDKITFPAEWHTVDKHSTGGVGDKISIVLAPIVAACGAKIPMISGRGLGHTGGTLDKLESIPNMRTDFSESEFKKFIQKVGFAIISQSDRLVPADRRIYALRDVTATVESLPLITASIMSKKIAEGAQNLVIDLKVGRGAFIKTIEAADLLAKLLMTTGKRLGQNVSVVFSNMNSPLGKYVGNALEIRECIEYLKGDRSEDIHELTKTLAVEMLTLCKYAKSKAEAGVMVEKVLSDGSALNCFKKFVEQQGGDARVCDDLALLPKARYEMPIIADKSGYIIDINTQQIGYALVDISAGRKSIKSQIDPAAGAYLPYKIGDQIVKGEKLGVVFANDESAAKNTAKKILTSYHISSEFHKPIPLIQKIVR